MTEQIEQNTATNLEQGPIWKVVADALEERIGSGQYPVGQLLPGLTELREEFGCSLAPVRQAQEELARRGLLVARQGVGVRVIAVPTEGPADRENIEELLAEAQALISRAVAMLSTR